jgi:hypothetical protein
VNAPYQRGAAGSNPAALTYWWQLERVFRFGVRVCGGLGWSRGASTGANRLLLARLIRQNFLYLQRDQPLLLPVDMREWLPEDDLVLVVLDAVAT